MDTPIRQFHEILFWPLEIPELGIGHDGNIQTFIETFTQDTAWFEDKTPAVDYAERVYFHPFVQRFLYDSKQNTLRVFKRNDINAVRLWLDDKLIPAELTVENMALHLFGHGLATFTLEVSANNRSLPQIQLILDRFRRAYPPYWETQDHNPGHCPLKVEWLHNGQAVAHSDYEDAKSFFDFADKHNKPRPSLHWQYLLQPLQVAGNAGAFTYRQIEDERMPFMAWLAVDNPTDLTRGDFIRLCFADGKGDSNTLPYARQFLQDFEEKHCYDRYWDHVEGDLEPHLRQDWMTTRYLLCGYGFVMVGKDDTKDEYPFFTDSKNGALAHFHRHYFKMGLIAHYHRAALLGFSDALSQAVKLTDTDPDQFRDRVKAILEGFLKFTHRYWFREVSNQVQARELFSLWTGHLENEKLFEQVKQEAQDANAFLDMRQQQTQTDTTVRLTVVATVGLAAGLAGTFLAIDWHELHELQFDVSALGDELLKVVLVALLVIGGIALAVWQSKWLADKLNGLADSRVKPRKH